MKTVRRNASPGGGPEGDENVFHIAHAGGIRAGPDVLRSRIFIT